MARPRKPKPLRDEASRSSRITAISRALSTRGDLTPREIAGALRIPYKCLYGNVNYLKWMKEHDMAHITSWRRQAGHGGLPEPVYSIGPGTNAHRPKPLGPNFHQNRRAAERRMLKSVQGLSTVAGQLSGLLKTAGITGT